MKIAAGILLLGLTVTTLHAQDEFVHPVKVNPSIEVAVKGGYGFASLNNWRSQFSPQPPGTVYQLGLEASYLFQSHFQIGGGYEYGTAKEVKIEGSSILDNDKLTYNFVYGSAKYGTFGRLFGDEVMYFGGVDVGKLTSTESIKGTNGVTVDGTGSVIAFRPKVGLMSFMNPTSNFSASFEIGYLAAKVSDVKTSGVTIPSYSHDFSGVTVAFGFSYHFILQSN